MSQGSSSDGQGLPLPAPLVCTTGTLTSDVGDSGPAGTQVTLTAAGGCDSDDTAEYELYEHPPGGDWFQVHPYSTTDTFAIDTTGKPDGEYRFQAWIRAQGSSSPVETVGYASFTVTSGTSVACTAGVLSGSPASPQQAGTPITLRATSASCANPQYLFYELAPGGQWTLVQPYSSSSTFNFPTDGSSPAGQYSFQAWVRDAGSTADFEAVDQLSYTITHGPATACSGSTLGATPVSPQQAGTDVTLHATSASCANPRYEFFQLDPGASTWTVKQDSASPDFAFDTHGAPGTYNFQVWVRDAGASVAFETFASAAYTLTPGPPSPPCGSATLTPSLASPQFRGATVKLSATSSACTNPQYEFFILPPGGAWTVGQAYSSTASFNFTTNGSTALGDYAFQVWVRDATSSGDLDTYAEGTYTIRDTGCGDGVINGNEVCDPGNGGNVAAAFGANTCVSLGHAPGKLACNSDCTLPDAATLIGPGLCDGGFVAANTGFTGKVCIDGLKFQSNAGNSYVATCSEDNGVWSGDLTDSGGNALQDPAWFLNDCSRLPTPCTTSVPGPVTSLHGRGVFTSSTSATTVVYLSTDAGNGSAAPNNGTFNEFRAPAFAAQPSAPANWASNANSLPLSFSQTLFTAILGNSSNNWLGGWDPVVGASVVHGIGVPANPVSVGGGFGTVTSLVSGVLATNNGNPGLDTHAAVFGKGPNDVHDNSGPNVAGGGIYWTCDLGATYIKDDVGIGSDGSSDESRVFTLAVDNTSAIASKAIPKGESAEALSSAVDNGDGTATFKLKSSAFIGQYFIGQPMVVTGYTAPNAGYNGTWQIVSFSATSNQLFTLGPFSGQSGIPAGLATVTAGTHTATPFISLTANGATEDGFTTLEPHGLTIGTNITISGVTNPGYNGNWVVASVTSPTSTSTHFTVVGLPPGLPTSGTDPGVVPAKIVPTGRNPRTCNTTPSPVNVTTYSPIMYAGLRGGVTPIYKTVDGGAHWTASSTGLRTGVIGGAPGVDVYAITVDTFDFNRLFAATGDGLYTSADGGAHWTRAGLEGQVVRSVAITPSHLAKGGSTPLLNAPRIFVGTDQPNGIFQSQFP